MQLTVNRQTTVILTATSVPAYLLPSYRQRLYIDRRRCDGSGDGDDLTAHVQRNFFGRILVVGADEETRAIMQHGRPKSVGRRTYDYD